MQVATQKAQVWGQNKRLASDPLRTVYALLLYHYYFFSPLLAAAKSPRIDLDQLEPNCPVPSPRGVVDMRGQVVIIPAIDRSLLLLFPLRSSDIDPGGKSKRTLSFSSPSLSPLSTPERNIIIAVSSNSSMITNDAAVAAAAAAAAVPSHGFSHPPSITWRRRSISHLPPTGRQPLSPSHPHRASNTHPFIHNYLVTI